MIKPGDVILYVPTHVQQLVPPKRVKRATDGSILGIYSMPYSFSEHPDCEVGFVTSIKPGVGAYCRFWSKVDPGDLRTKANSELARFEDLQRSSWWLQDAQKKIDALCEKYEIEIRRDNDS